MTSIRSGLEQVESSLSDLQCSMTREEVQKDLAEMDSKVWELSDLIEQNLPAEAKL